MQTMHNEDEFVVASLLASDAEVLLSLGSQAQVETNAEMTALLSWTARYLGTEHGEHTPRVQGFPGGVSRAPKGI